jgi:hypothetical protein
VNEILIGSQAFKKGARRCSTRPFRGVFKPVQSRPKSDPKYLFDNHLRSTIAFTFNQS